MSEEAAFQRAIADAAEDDAPRLVYADWLDERGEAARAEYLRLGRRGRITDAGWERLAALSARLDPSWLRTVHHGRWLTSLVSPPPVPVEVPSDADWLHVESRLDRRLPEDYKRIVAAYGSGLMARWITVLNPRSQASEHNLVEWATYVIEVICRGIHRLDEDEDFEYPFYPSEGGLLPCAHTLGGDQICWLTRGDPADWPIVVLPREIDERVGPYRGPLADFLVDLFLGTVRSVIWNTYPPKNLFEPRSIR
jgi:uncharacterized protein (TIGR02996 family)